MTSTIIRIRGDPVMSMPATGWASRFMLFHERKKICVEKRVPVGGEVFPVSALDLPGRAHGSDGK